MQDPIAILHKRSTQILTKLKPWNLPGTMRLIRFSKRASIKKPYYFIASAIQKAMERYEINIFRRLIKPGMTVIDIGANIGVYTKIACDIVGPKGKVFAFEPESENLIILKEKLAVFKNSNVTVISKALSDKIGEERLYIDEVNVGNHSMSEKNILKGNNFIKIQTTTLDKYFSDKGKVDLIKMDVQGAEGKIIKGAENILTKYKPTMMVEFWPDGLINCGSNPLNLLIRLKEFGFQINLIDKTHKKLLKITPREIVKICEEKRNHADYTNLVLSANIL